MEAARDAGGQSSPPPPADTATKGRSRGDAAAVAALIFFVAGIAISSLWLGLLVGGGMVREGINEDHAWPSWYALVFVAPLYGVLGTILYISGALAVAGVLAAAAAALLRRVPFWAFLAIAAPCLLASHLQFAWLANLNHWGEPPSPGYCL